MSFFQNKMNMPALSLLFLALSLFGNTTSASTESFQFPMQMGGTVPYSIPLPTTISSNGGGDSANVYISKDNSDVTRVTASGSANNSVTFTISGGADRAMFTIHPFSGVLTLNTSTILSGQTDANNDDAYEVEVSATDNIGFSDRQLLTVFAPGGGATSPVQIVQASSCSEVSLKDFVIHSYEGEVQSFEFSAPEAYRNKIETLTVAGVKVPLSYVTYWEHPSTSEIRVHVDVPTTLTQTSQIITVTFQAMGNTRACTFTIPMTSVQPGEGTILGQSTTPGAHSGLVLNPGANIKPVTQSGIPTTTPGQMATTTASTSSGGTAVACIPTPLGVWAVLLIGQVLILAGIYKGWRANSIDAKTALITASIASFIALAAGWYWLDTCREYVWFPVISAVVACLAILSTLGSNSQGRYN